MAQTKSELRKFMRIVVNSMSMTERRRQSDIVFAKLIKHPRYQSSSSISIYLSTDNEIDTEPILRHALEVSSKRCFIPVIRPVTGSTDCDYNKQYSTRMLMIELSSMNEFSRLPINHYGIKEPDLLDVPPSKIANPISGPKLDLALVPGVAFSSDGRRLGHGKGYYDEFLSDWKLLCEQGPIYSIGLAFNELIVRDPLAVEAHDYRLDEVLTGSQ